MATYKYDSYNKLHWLLGSDKYATEVAKQKFEEELKIGIEKEKEYCKKHNLPISMNKEKHTHVLNLLGRCANFYEVEALARFIYDDNRIPEYEEIKKRGSFLKSIIPVKDILSKHKNPRRSF